ncbi:MAG: hypothetical protein ACXQS8_09560 [Candidatus Helarchaeales archaeon]
MFEINGEQICDECYMDECDSHYCLERHEKMARKLSRDEVLRRIPEKSRRFYEIISLQERTPEEIMQELNLKQHEFKVILTYFRDIGWAKLIEKSGKILVKKRNER